MKNAADRYVVVADDVRYLTYSGIWTRDQRMAGRWPQAEARRRAAGQKLLVGRAAVKVRKATLCS